MTKPLNQLDALETLGCAHIDKLDADDLLHLNDELHVEDNSEDDYKNKRSY